MPSYTPIPFAIFFFPLSFGVLPFGGISPGLKREKTSARILQKLNSFFDKLPSGRALSTSFFWRLGYKIARFVSEFISYQLPFFQAQLNLFSMSGN